MTHPTSSPSRFSRRELIVAAGSLLILVSSPTHWMSYQGLYGVGIINGAGLFTLLACLGVVALLVLRSPLLRNSIELPNLPATESVLFSVGGGVELAGLILFYLQYRGKYLGSFSRSVDFGFAIALAGAVLTLGASFTAMRSGASTLHGVGAGLPAGGPPSPPLGSTAPAPPSPPLGSTAPAPPSPPLGSTAPAPPPRPASPHIGEVPPLHGTP